MTISLENTFLKVSFDEHGGELTSLFNKKNKLEYLWQANPKYWGRHAPVLFPIVGRLKNDEYSYEEHKYRMTQHGFARDMDFEIETKTDKLVVFRLKSNEKTMQKYPFEFVLRIKYELMSDTLKVSYLVDNPSKNQLLFSVGGHPAFNVPLSSTETFSDYHVAVAPNRIYQQIQLQGNYSDSRHPLDFTAGTIDVTRETFKNDAVILKLEEKSTELTLTTAQRKNGIRFNTGNAQYVGVWSKYPEEAPFVCVEPWWGLADDVSASGELTEKVGVHVLKANESFSGFYKVQVF
ncbi:aldose 1-epimerase family protein [Liquorilactobacillus mali]|uniref:aldose 1-epimerase family protein n=1 Tax=Liquorilactobacillus mali TaxID=1618 RepID=UPI0029556473|nr:aldose 1-epimerase family protein [Liquorilactobacillus mali]MDV7756884.1 aldose 1-epimerase family protein [Liquorilactobacillus mali]